MAIQIKSEIGKLNKVLLYRPGKELEHEFRTLKRTWRSALYEYAS